ncbi:MAG: site-specific integrase [Treponema sp.]|nr:site-specific integrase [Treponema sp.]
MENVMPRVPKPFITPRRNDAKTYQISLNPSCGLPERICQQWKRRSFQDFPPELAQFRNPKNKAAAQASAFALIEFLKKAQKPDRVPTERITVGVWLEKFTKIEESPKAARLLAENTPYSIDTIYGYACFFRSHLKGDPFLALKMGEVEEPDAILFIGRIANHEIHQGNRKDTGKRKLVGTRTFEAIIKFVRMCFHEYQKSHAGWCNPFIGLDPPKKVNRNRDAFTEDEVVSLFGPDVLKDTMELAVAAAMFMAGLRRGEIFALKPEDLDWRTPKILIRRAWQDFDRRSREMGPTKGKKERLAPFDSVLQEAIKKLWEENGKHEFVFSFANGKTPGPSWTRYRFKKWIARAGIKLNGRKIVPHSSRHSLASLLEARGVSIRYIQDLLGHSDLKTTKTYLHSTDATIRDVGKKIETAMNEQPNPPENISLFEKTM